MKYTFNTENTMKVSSLLFIAMLGLFCFAIDASAQAYLSPEEYRSKVEDYSLLLKQQKLRNIASSESVKLANSAFFPQIDVNGEAMSNLRELGAWNAPVGQYRPYSYQAMLSIGQPIYTGGALSARQNIAQSDEAISRLMIELTKDQIRYQSQVVYWQASAYAAELKVARAFEQIVQKQYDLIKARNEEGAIGYTDLLMISTRKKETELQTAKAHQQYALALQKLNILMGKSPDSPVDSLAPINSLNQNISDIAIDDVLKARSEYQEAEIRISKSEEERILAMSQYMPKVNAFASAGWSTGTPYLGQSVAFTPIAGINVNIPIYRWGASSHIDEMNKVNTDIQKMQLGIIKDRITEELMASKTKVSESLLQVKTAEETMQLATENLDLMSFSYQEGKVSMADILNSQLSWLQANTNLIYAHLAAKLAIAEHKRVVSEN